VQVVVRLRPINEEEKRYGTLPVVTASSKEKTVTVVKGQGHRQSKMNYNFNNVFASFSSQEEVFQATLLPVIGDVMQGYESTVFAYGQTGTGKTHTMEGNLQSQEHYGVIPRSIQYMFTLLANPQYTSRLVTVSYLEIYNEELSDLLLDNYSSPNKNSSKNKLEIMESKDGTVCRGLTQKEVMNADDVLTIMKKAQQQRKIGETEMNKHSSRSHCIFTVKINAKKELVDGSVLEVHGKLHLVDLAGSECAKSARSTTPTRDKHEHTRERERSNINRSLLTLGRVILMLNEKGKKGDSSKVRIPYRDSKLTRILQRSLGGACKTLIIATLSPSINAIEESISTLNYAQSANGIKNKPVAISYLSVGSNFGSGNSIMSSEASMGDTQHNVEHWYEMECRLQYMQTQVEEAQSALARTYMQQQEIVERAEAAENSLAEKEKQYNEAIECVDALRVEVEKEKEQREILAKKKKETEIKLFKTEAVLQATQYTETNLTEEATTILGTLDKSIVDGDGMHKELLEINQSEVDRRDATQKFQSTNVNILKTVLNNIHDFAKQEELYQKNMIETAEKSFVQDTKSLEESISVAKKTSSSVKELTNKIKSHIEDDDGTLALLSVMTSNVHDNANKTKEYVIKEEDELSKSLLSTRDELGTYAEHLKKMDSEYISASDDLANALNLNLSTSIERVDQMIRLASDMLAQVRAANVETEKSLNNILNKIKTDSHSSSTHIEQASTGQNDALLKSIAAFVTGMEHNNMMTSELKEQDTFIGGEGKMHMKKVTNQMELVTAQKKDLIKAQEDQKTARDEFVSTVLKGVESLVREQMSSLESKQEAQMVSFKNRNDKVMDMNKKIDESSSNIFQTVTETNKSLSTHVEHTKENDSSMRVAAEEARTAFVDIDKTSKAHMTAISGSLAKAKEDMNDLTTHNNTIGTTVDKLQKDTSVCKNHLQQSKDDERKRVEQLNSAAKDNAKYVSQTVIKGTQEKLVSIEKPRKEVVEYISSNLDQLKTGVRKSQKKLQDIITTQLETAGQLRANVDSICDDFTTNAAVERREEISEKKASMVERTDQFGKESAEERTKAVEYTSTVKTNVEGFAVETLKCNETVPEVQPRKKYSYSKKLSATPAPEIIYKGLDLPN